MKIKMKETRLTDGSMVYDVDIFSDATDKMTGERKSVFSCYDEKSARLFLEHIENAIKSFTLESVELIP